jgi:hypothetical protein
MFVTMVTWTRKHANALQWHRILRARHMGSECCITVVAWQLPAADLVHPQRQAALL